MTERNLPVTLRERMNDDGEIFIFHEWFQGYSSKMGNPSITLELYDKDSSRWVPTIENRDLRAAIERYLETEPASDFWGNVNPDSCSWDQVFAELEDTKKVYWSKADGNPIRRCFRHGQGFSRNVMPLLESIPQDDGLGLLKGGLQVLFNAVKRRTDTCERIFDSFEHIPICIVNGERLRQIHPREESLFSAINNLYDQLVKSIPLLIDVLLRKGSSSKMKKLGKSVFGDSVVEVENILKPVKSAETRLEQCRLDLNTRGIAENSHYLRHTHVKLDSLEQKIDIMEEKVETWRAEHKEMHRSLIDESLRQVVEEMKNSMYVACQDKLRIEWLSSEMDSNRALTPSRRLTIGDVMGAICTEAERAIPLQDLALVLRKYHEFSSKALSQANYIMTTPKFQSWLTSPESAMLLVDGHCGDQSIGKIAPTSCDLGQILACESGKEYKIAA
ncbi:hypothetical protein CEP54_007595 [Fusarium duplospermum]|uniref:Uncharacterized protein n=1 Tax=Fusarium duplospermum TaxID=1325734 RepID=A0A428Q0L4_9HYPO|nr:hypothetical protein CEP54_007595 [Fusarium duplospermum]